MNTYLWPRCALFFKTYSIFQMYPNICEKCFFCGMGGNRKTERRKDPRRDEISKNRLHCNKFWFQKADPHMVLPQRLNSDWGWVMCGSLLTQGADLGITASECIWSTNIARGAVDLSVRFWSYSSTTEEKSGTRPHSLYVEWQILKNVICWALTVE